MASLVATGGLLVATADPATAAVARGANGQCYRTDFCGWRHDAKGGGIFDTPYADDDYDWHGIEYWHTAIAVNDSLSSIQNAYRTYPAQLYQHDGYSGTAECFPRQMTTYRNIKDGLEDEASSHKAVTSC